MSPTAERGRSTSAGEDRLAEPRPGAQAASGRATGKRSDPRRRPRPKPHLALVPGGDMEQLDAEPLVVVEVDDRPGAEAQRWPVPFEAGLPASPDRRLESR